MGSVAVLLLLGRGVRKVVHGGHVNIPMLAVGCGNIDATMPICEGHIVKCEVWRRWLGVRQKVGKFRLIDDHI